MVSHDNAESRAGTLTLIGGELAFDFANTASGRGFASAQEHLRSGRNVVEWARHAKVLALPDGEWLSQTVLADEALARRLLRRALDLRDTIYATSVEVAHGKAAPQEGVERIARAHATCLACAKLTPFRDRYVWTWSARDSAIEAVLGPVALSALTTLTQTDLTRIKQCQGEQCGWLFLDTTKNKSRRWCEMEVCGNRAKQKRLAAKKRKA